MNTGINRLANFSNAFKIGLFPVNTGINRMLGYSPATLRTVPREYGD